MTLRSRVVCSTHRAGRESRTSNFLMAVRHVWLLFILNRTYAWLLVLETQEWSHFWGDSRGYFRKKIVSSCRILVLKTILFCCLVMKVINVRGSPNESWETVTTQFIFVSLPMGFMSLLNILLVVKIIYLHCRKFEERYLKIQKRVKTTNVSTPQRELFISG